MTSTDTTTDADLRDQLWRAVLAKVDELARHGNRGMAYYGADGRSCMTVAKRHQDDGTSLVLHIEARHYLGEISTTVERSVSSGEHFWEPIAEVAANRLEALVVGDRCYTVRPDERHSGGFGVGFGGRKFVVEWLDEHGRPTGETLTTRNLWSRVTIPPMFRDRLKPNARFVIDEARGDTR